MGSTSISISSSEAPPAPKESSKLRRWRRLLLLTALLVVTFANAAHVVRVQAYFHLQLSRVFYGCRTLEKSHVDPNFYRNDACLTRGQVLTIIKELVFTAADAFDAHNVTYFLDSGTLLGAFRNQSVITHDIDADMGIDAAGLHYLQHHAVGFPKEYAFTVWNSSLYPHSDRDDKLPARLVHKDSGIYLDVFAFLDWQDNTVGPLPSWCFLSCAGCPKLESGEKLLHVPRDWIYPAVNCSFEGRTTLKCPQTTERYLEYTFGEDFMTPIKYTYR